MPSRPSDQALRRFVAKLTTISTDDVQAILAALDAPGRRRVETLLSGQIDAVSSPPPERAAASPARPAASLPPGLSPSVAERLSDILAPSTDTGSRVTPSAAAFVQERFGAPPREASPAPLMPRPDRKPAVRQKALWS